MSRLSAPGRHGFDYEYGPGPADAGPEPSWEVMHDHPFQSLPRRSLSGGLGHEVGGVDARLRPRDRFFRQSDESDRQTYVLVDRHRERDRERDKDVLKQRMARPSYIYHGNGHGPPSSSSAATSGAGLRRHNRARSLSLSRASSSESLSLVSYDEERDKNLNHLSHRPLIKYYHKQPPHPPPRPPRTPKAALAWPSSSSRPHSRMRSPGTTSERELERVAARDVDVYARGYHLAERPLSTGHVVPAGDPRLGLHASPFQEDMRYAFQRMSLGPDVRALSSRSASFETNRSSGGDLVRREHVSSSPRHRDRL